MDLDRVVGVRTVPDPPVLHIEVALSRRLLRQLGRRLNLQRLGCLRLNRRRARLARGDGRHRDEQRDSTAKLHIAASRRSLRDHPPVHLRLGLLKTLDRRTQPETPDICDGLTHPPALIDTHAHTTSPAQTRAINRRALRWIELAHAPY